MIERLAGMQAQQARPPFIGLWSRIDGFHREDLLRLVHGREVVKATMMRATLHLMSAKEYALHRPAMQPALWSSMRSVLSPALQGLEMQELLDHARPHFAEGVTFAELRARLGTVFPEYNERLLGYAVRTNLPLATVPDESDWGYRATARFVLADQWLSQPLGTVAQPEAWSCVTCRLLDLRPLRTCRIGRGLRD